MPDIVLELFYDIFMTDKELYIFIGAWVIFCVFLGSWQFYSLLNCQSQICAYKDSLNAAKQRQKPIY